MFIRNCTNCAWYCHADGKCYGNPYHVGAELLFAASERSCDDYAFDGLSDEEREELDALVTMETVK